jgi:hypothetical protein
LLLVLTVGLGVTAAILVKFRQEPRDYAAGSATSNQSAENWTPAPDPRSETVSLAIDFGNGARREFAALPWKDGMTVADLLKSATAFRPGLAFSQQGEGAQAFLTSLDGVAGRAEGSRFWLYEVNGEPGKVSFAIQRLAAGDRVLWAFKPPE